MAKTIGIISIKGGVGKTTIASSLAADLANNQGKKVLLVDANYSAPNLGLHMDIVEPIKTIHEVIAGKARPISAIHKRHGVDVIPGSFNYNRELNYLKLKDRLSQIKNDYDYVILDSSPSMNDEVLSTMIAADNLFVVTTPDFPTMSCSLKAAKLAKQRGKPVSGIIVNKIREPKFEINLDSIEETLGIPVVARIEDDKSNIGALFERTPTSIYNKKGKFAKEINRLGSALAGSSEKIGWSRFFGGVKLEQANRQVLKHDFYKSMFD